MARHLRIILVVSRRARLLWVASVNLHLDPCLNGTGHRTDTALMRTYTNISTRTGKPVKSKVELAERIDAKLRELRLHSGPDEFDPVLLMAIIAAESYDAGDTAMALTAAREVAQYVRPKLSAVAVVADVNLNVDPDVIGARDRFMALVMSGDKETLDPYRDDRTVDCDAFPEGLDSKDKFLAIVKANPHLVDELMEAEADEAIPAYWPVEKHPV